MRKMGKWKAVFMLLIIAVIASFVILLVGKKLVNPTIITINNKEIKLGMTLEKVQDLVGHRYKLSNYNARKGNVCKDVWVKYSLLDCYSIEENDFFGGRGRACLYFNKKEKLQEIYITYDNDYAETVFSKLKEEYGDNYTYDWLNGENYNAVKGYRWDLENGTSILWLPETADSEFKELIITYTDDITEVVPPLVEE